MNNHQEKVRELQASLNLAVVALKKIDKYRKSIPKWDHPKGLFEEIIDEALSSESLSKELKRLSDYWEKMVKVREALSRIERNGYTNQPDELWGDPHEIARESIKILDELIGGSV